MWVFCEQAFVDHPRQKVALKTNQTLMKIQQKVWQTSLHENEEENENDLKIYIIKEMIKTTNHSEILSYI